MRAWTKQRHHYTSYHVQLFLLCFVFFILSLSSCFPTFPCSVFNSIVQPFHIFFSSLSSFPSAVFLTVSLLLLLLVRIFFIAVALNSFFLITYLRTYAVAIQSWRVFLRSSPFSHPPPLWRALMYWLVAMGPACIARTCVMCMTLEGEESELLLGSRFPRLGAHYSISLHAIILTDGCTVDSNQTRHLFRL